jgi:hypothetical protein
MTAPYVNFFYLYRSFDEPTMSLVRQNNIEQIEPSETYEDST